MLVPKINRITNVQPMFVCPYNANAMCVSIEAAVAMRAGLSMGEASNLHHQTGCMLRCSKGQGSERYNRCVCKSRTYSEAARRSR